ncbi:hypothetical protein J6590_040597 [Homalodisca vitripennis]|nr:hypothetical protein J6590_040597 [Homalodisca vitripennis]
MALVALSLESLSNLLWDFAKSEGVECDVVCGVPYTALPLATLIAVKADLPMLIRRKEAKDYGTKKLIEGVYSKDDLCIIFEDVVTTGSSILETVNDLKHEGLVVKEVVAVLDREQGGIGNLARQGISLKPLMTLTQILRHLKAAGKIDDNTINRIQTYVQQNQLDPRGEPIKSGSKTKYQKCLNIIVENTLNEELTFVKEEIAELRSHSSRLEILVLEKAEKNLLLERKLKALLDQMIVNKGKQWQSETKSLPPAKNIQKPHNTPVALSGKELF